MNQSARYVTLLLTAFVCISASVAFAENTIHEDVAYVVRDGVEVSYDVVSPPEAHGAAVVLMSSGGWFSRKRPLEQIQQGFGYLLDAGFTLVAVRHRSAPEFKVPHAVADVQLAIRHIRHHAGDYGIDADRLAAMGFSSGGHLTLMIALDADRGETDSGDAVAATPNHVAAAVAYFPPVDLNGITGPNERFPALDFDAALANSVSPINFVDAEDPPVLLLHGTEDNLVPLSNSSRMHAKLEEVGGDVELSIFEGAGHGFREEHHNKRAQTEILTFLGAHLAGS